MIDASKEYNKHKVALQQLFKYGVVGVTTNMLGYFVFLLITYFGIQHKLAMTILYCIGVVVSYQCNRSWTFDHQGSSLSTPLKFLIAHGFGYSLNLIMLFVGVNYLGYSYQLIQFIAIFVVAAFLFAVFKLFVFENCKPNNL